VLDQIGQLRRLRADLAPTPSQSWEYQHLVTFGPSFD
jgi:hypothetical protein